MFIRTGQACSGGSGTSKELSNSMRLRFTRSSSSSSCSLLGRGLRHAAVRLRPAGRIVQELLDLAKLDRVELAACLGELEHVPPRAQMMQLDVEVGKDFFAVGIDAVIKDDENVLDDGAGRPQRVAEVDLTAAIRGQVLDQQDALA